MATKVKKRTVDNWKKKRWFEVFADSTFDGKIIAETVAIESKKLIGRKVKKSLKELTGSVRDTYYELTFRINKVTATKADTELVKFDTKTNFLRRLLRRGKSKIEPIIYVNTKEGKKIKLKVLFITGARYTLTQRKEAQKIITEYMLEDIKTKTISENWNDIVYQKFGEKLKKKLLKIGFVNKIFISKAQLVE
jgi:small subunit ribosomal protein S3Ae